MDSPDRLCTGQEVNGLMTYDCKPKFDSKALHHMNQMLR